MSTKKKGVIIVEGEWRKHLRPYGKGLFWKKHRKADRCLAANGDPRRGVADRTLARDEFLGAMLSQMRSIRC